MKRETPNQRLRRELLDVKKKLFKVCTDPNSNEAKDIIVSQKHLEYISTIPSDSFLNKLKELGLGPAPTEFKHYES